MTSKKPNILLAIADDASHMSCYGHDFLSTPNCDRVAREGIKFNNAFTTNPKCAPSRACILTGMHTWNLEDACNHYGYFPNKFSVYPDLLEASGYHVGFTGKGWAPGDYTARGFSRNPAGDEYNNHFLIPPKNSAISNRDYFANFTEFLKKKGDNQPFCFWYGGHEPHRHYVEGEGTRGGLDAGKVKVPGYLPDDKVVKNDLIDYAYEIEWFDTQLGEMINRLEEIGELENTLIIVTSDNGMPFPRVKGQMYEQDFHLPFVAMWKDTIACNREADDLVSFVDLAPTILDAAGVNVPDEMSGKSLINILKSEENGVIEPFRNEVFMGKERHDLGRKDDQGYPVRCIRTRQYLYVRNFYPERWPAGNPETGFTNCDSSPTKDLILYLKENGNDKYYDLAFGKRPLEELYNISTDSECVKNLADSDEYKDIKNMLWDSLKSELLKSNDPRIKGEGDVFDEYKYVGDDSHSWKAYEENRFKKQDF